MLRSAGIHPIRGRSRNGARRLRRLGAAAVALAVGGVALPASTPAATFSNPAAITINDSPGGCSNPPTQAQATPYPSQIQVSGLVPPVSDVNATLSGFSHTNAPDVRVLLVGPHGQSTLLMDQAGDATDVSNLTLTFDDAAAAFLPEPLVSGTFKPTQDDNGCFLWTSPNVDLPPPAPPRPYGTVLAAFDGTDPNGTWSLYVSDNVAADTGSISGGWSLDVSGPTPPTAPAAPTTPSQAEDPKCAHLRRKLRRQKKGLARAGSEAKRSMIKANIEDTHERLRRLGC